MNDLEDIKLLEKVCQRPIEETEGTKILKQAIQNLINKYKKILEYVHYLEEIRVNQTYENEEQEKIIELMAEAFKQDDVRNKEEIIEYFRKKAKGE